MKKLTFFAIAFFVTTFAGAQVRFGLKAGLNLSNWTVSPKDDETSFKIKPSFNAGGMAYIPLFGKFGLQPEIVYSAQGTKVSSSGDGGSYITGNINVPILFKYKDPSGFFAEVGPQVGFLLSAKAKSGSTSMDEKQYFKSTDFSGVLGIGYLSNLNVGVDARYNLGFTDLLKDGSNGTIKNNVIQVGVFYLFGKSKK